MSDPLVGVDARLEQLTGPDADLLGYFKADDTDQGVYYLTLRSWPHPDVDGATILALRYAYLTRGDGSDGWTESGVNMRVSGDPVAFLQALSQMAAAAIPRQGNPDADPWTGDGTED